MSHSHHLIAEQPLFHYENESVMRFASVEPYSSELAFPVLWDMADGIHLQA